MSRIRGWKDDVGERFAGFGNAILEQGEAAAQQVVAMPQEQMRKLDYEMQQALEGIMKSIHDIDSQTTQIYNQIKSLQAGG